MLNFNLSLFIYIFTLIISGSGFYAYSLKMEEKQNARIEALVNKITVLENQINAKQLQLESQYQQSITSISKQIELQSANLNFHITDPLPDASFVTNTLIIFMGIAILSLGCYYVYTQNLKHFSQLDKDIHDYTSAVIDQNTANLQTTINKLDSSIESNVNNVVALQESLNNIKIDIANLTTQLSLISTNSNTINESLTSQELSTSVVTQSLQATGML